MKTLIIITAIYLLLIVLVVALCKIRAISDKKAKEIFNNKKAQWDNEKASVEKVSKLREELEQIHDQIQIAQRDGNLEVAAELSYGKLPALQKQLEIEEDLIKKADFSLVHESVSEEEIAKLPILFIVPMFQEPLSLKYTPTLVWLT